MKVKAIITSMRLRTLPLSLAGVVLGIMLACADGAPVNVPVIVFIITTTLCLQILSNLSNELGDFLRGTDDEERKGPKYALQSGGLEVKEFKTLIFVFVVLCCVNGLAMTWFSFPDILEIEPLMILLLGVFAIQAAMKYTLGKNPYGYRGLGDIFVFTFFGLVSVLGAFFMLRHTIPSWVYLLPAASIGLLSVGVLNVNNIRDMSTDAGTRVTVPLKIGEWNAKIYHTVLVAGAWVCIVAFTLLRFPDPWHWLYVVTLPIYIMHVIGVWRKSGRELDSELPKLVMTTFLFSILCGTGFMAFLWR